MVFESLVLEVSKETKQFYLVVDYRPPLRNINEFFMLLEEQLDMIRSRNFPIFVCGDFNLRLQSQQGSLLIQHRGLIILLLILVTIMQV